MPGLCSHGRSASAETPAIHAGVITRWEEGWACVVFRAQGTYHQSRASAAYLLDLRIPSPAEHLPQELVDVIIARFDGQAAELVAKLREGHLSRAIRVEDGEAGPRRARRGGAGSERSSVSAGLPATPSAQVVREGLVGRVLLKVVVHLGGHDSEEFLQRHLARTIGIHLLPVDHDMGKKTPGHMRQAMGAGPLAARTAGSPPRPG